AAGARVDDPVGTVDVAATALAACGVAVPRTMEGRPLLDGARQHVPTEDDMLRGSFPFRTLTPRRYRMTRDEVVPERGELYDLAEDPGELVNRWAGPGLRAVRRDLLALLADAVGHHLGRELPQVCQAG